MILQISFYKDKYNTESFSRIFEYIGYFFFAFFVLSPVVHTWYLLWPIICFILIIDKKFYPYWVFLFISYISYLFTNNGAIILNYIDLLIIEYGILYLSLIYFLARNEKFKNIVRKLKSTNHFYKF